MALPMNPKAYFIHKGYSIKERTEGDLKVLNGKIMD
jgi:hypothetical protein